MPNSFFNNTFDLIDGTKARATAVESNFSAVETGFDLAAAQLLLKPNKAGDTYTGTHNFSGATVNLPPMTVANSGSAIRQTATATGGQTVFTLSPAYIPGANNLQVYINGVRQHPGTYTETNSTTVTFSDPLTAGDSVLFETGTITFGSSNTAALTSFTPTAAIPQTNVQAALENLIPSMTGQAGKFLSNNGVTDNWAVADVSPVGTIVYAPTAPTSGTWLKCDGSSYLQATYPALYSQLGLLQTLPPQGWRSPSNGPGPSTSLAQLESVNSTFLSVAGTTAYRSTDGFTWTSTGPSTNYLSVFGSTVIANVSGSGNIQVSTDDGATWSANVATGLTTVANDRKTAFLGGRYFAYQTSSPFLASSASATSGWVACSGISSALYQGGNDYSQRANPMRGGIAFANGVWLAAGTTANTVFSSTDGVNWSSRTPGTDATNAPRVFAANNRLFASCDPTGTNAFLRTSTDGVTWSGTHPLNGQSSPGGVQDIRFINGAYYAWNTTGGIGGIFKSTDGVAWTVLHTQRDQTFGAWGFNSSTFGSIAVINNVAYWASITTNAAAIWTLSDGVVSCEPIVATTAPIAFAQLASGAMTEPVVRGNSMYWVVSNGNNAAWFIMKRVGQPVTQINPMVGLTQNGSATPRIMATNNRVLFSNSASSTTMNNASAISDLVASYNSATEFAVPAIPATLTPAYIKAA